MTSSVMIDDSTSAQAVAEGKPAPKLVYKASGGRKTFFSFAFLILLPFFASLPAMIYARVTHGLWLDSVGLAIFALCFTAVMFLLLVELMLSLRSRVVLGPKGVKMTLPSGRGPTPMLRYRTNKMDYDEIQSVETRREVYGGSLAPVLMKGARIIKKDGETVKLGYVNESNVDPTFPYPVIAKHIADRARLPLIDRGNVRRSARAKFLGLRSRAQSGDRTAAADDTLDEDQITELNHRHRSVMLGVLGALAILLLLGIALDIASQDPISLRLSR